jgi:NADPH:quinone reductase
VGPRSRVLVQAGASGSGSMAIQVAKALGADVITTVSTDYKAALAHSMGADEVVRYRETDVAKAVSGWAGKGGIDVVIDPVGGTTMAANLDCLRPRGTVVNFGLTAGAQATIPHLYPFFRNEKRLVGAWMGSMAELRFGLDLVKQGRIRAALHKTMPLKHAREAHRMMARAEVGPAACRCLASPLASGGSARECQHLRCVRCAGAARYPFQPASLSVHGHSDHAALPSSVVDPRG